MQVPLGSEYYSGKTILLTGATGLVGKALVEAILRKLPHVERVYLLIRPRTGASGETVPADVTLNKEILASSAFDFLRARHGDGFEAFARRRLEPVAGDLSQERLGLRRELYGALRDEVDVVINSGALAVFDAPLDRAVQINTLGPRRILDFARGAAKRPFVAHVSTCYVSNVAGPVFETPLEPDWTPSGPDSSDPFDADRELQRVLGRVDAIRSREPDARLLMLRHQLRSGSGRGGGARATRNGAADLTGRLREEWTQRRLVAEGLRWARRRGWKDTYTFTKAMGEQLFARHQGDVPGLVLRPSVIESALRTPGVGWIDGYRMLDPLIVGFARGQITEFPGNPEAVLDVVPVDAVVNALLMSIPWTHSGAGPRVYHVASGMENPLIMSEFRDYVVEYFEKTPLRRARAGADGGLPHLSFPAVDRFLRHLDYRYLLPIRLLETGYLPFKATPWGRRRHEHLRVRRARLEWLRATAAIYGPYGESRSRFLTYNTHGMWRALPDPERRTFPFDIRELEWKRYLQEVHLPGIERYLLRLQRRRSEPVEMPQATAGTCAADAAGAATEEQPSRWPGAEKILARTREASAVEASTWTTPLYKKAIKRASVQAIRLVCRRRLQLECVGEEHVPERGPFILVANHTSHVDTGVLLAALGRHAMQAHPTAAADYWFRSPAVAWLLHSTLGGIPFDRHRPNVPRALALPAQVLRNGHSLIFYPEGTRSPDGELGPFKSTAGLLALASGAPIVPAYIVGASKALPKGARSIKRHPVRVHFGPPTSIEAYLERLGRETVSSVSRGLAQDAHAAVARLRDLATAQDAAAR